ncbi:MAG TPA: type II toxin-antitoxin system RelB/DinJ family antitoxin [Candidatus Paceibacterota bacterium]
MKTVLNVKMDASLKKQAQKVAKEMGLPMSLIFSNLAKQFVDQKQITFSASLTPNKKTAKILREALADIKKGKNLSPSFKSGKDMDKYLDSL